MNIVSIISPLIDVSTRRRGEAEECGEGGISIAEGVNRKAGQKCSEAGRRIRAGVRGISSGRTGGSLVSARSGADQGRLRPRADYGGVRGEGLPRVSPLPNPQCDWELALGLCWSQAAAGSARLLLTTLVHPPSLCNYCQERAPCSALKVTNFSKRKERKGSS